MGLKIHLLAIAVLTLLIVAAPIVAAAETSGAFKMQGEIRRGEEFSVDMGGGLRFALIPNEWGWYITVHPVGDKKVDLAGRTLPLRGTNSTQIFGWHFRNADNSGPNEIGEKNVNAPQKIRHFEFCRSAKALRRFFEVARVGTCRDCGCPGEGSPGSGTLTIRHLTLGNLELGKRAWIELMQFGVKGTMKGKPTTNGVSTPR